MVVLESKGMLTAGSNQYLQPDYLSPLPTTVSLRSLPLWGLSASASTKHHSLGIILFEFRASDAVSESRALPLRAID